MTSLTAEWSRLPLGVLAFRGRDARRFLQGQLSVDVLKLAPGELRWSGYHNPQGRALALPRLCADGDDVLALVPRDLLAPVTQQLRRYVLRSKVSIVDESATWAVFGLRSPPQACMGMASAGHVLPADPAGTRTCLLMRESAVAGLDLNPLAERSPNLWKRLDIADGLPQVYACTSGRFVAQMLNLDLIGGISFDKGCYTGQEVIARAHYRGRVKRRMQRFRSLSCEATQWPAGTIGELPDGRRFEVVDSVDLDTGAMEFLAVTNLPTAGMEQDSTGETVVAGHPAHAARCADAIALQLPYSLP